MKRFFRTGLVIALLFRLTQLFAQTGIADQKIPLFFEKAYIQTDRDIYAQGEDIWFKAYLTNAQDNHLIETSKTLYVQLLSAANVPVNQIIVPIAKGTGKGDFKLSDTLSAGTYYLKAYTNWMRNFGDDFIFQKIITVAGKSNQAVIKAKELGKQNHNLLNTAQAAPIFNVRFFPEGGSLVNNISSVIAVKAEDANGRGVSATIIVHSATGDTVAHCVCDTLGFGLFSILPVDKMPYKAICNYNHTSLQTELPSVLNKGLSIRILQKDTIVYALVQSNSADSGFYAGKDLMLTASHAGKKLFDNPLHLTNGHAELRINSSVLPVGITDFILYDNQHKPNCERLFYANLNKQAHLIISTTKSIFKQREKVTVNINAYDENNQPLSGDFSLAATEARFCNSMAGIKPYLTLQSELKGYISHPEIYFDANNPNRVKQLDELMLTQGWRDFIWRHLEDSSINIAYLPEQGLSLTGSVKNGSGKLPLVKTNITLNLPDASGQKLFSAQTNDAGKFYFDNLQLFGNQHVKVSSRDNKGKSSGLIQLDSLFNNNWTAARTKLPDIKALPASVNDELLSRTESIQRDSSVTLKEVKIKARNLLSLRDQTAVGFGYPDEVLTPTAADNKFTNLREYLLYASNLAKIDDQSDQIVFHADGATIKPRIVIDNKNDLFTDETDDEIKTVYYNTYYNMPVSAFNKITIRHFLSSPKLVQGPAGAANATGNSVAASRVTAIRPIFLIYLDLKPNAFQLNPSSVTSTLINGYYEARNFYKPIYDMNNINSQTPDLRSTIHWQPEITTDVNGHAAVAFFNGDVKTGIKVMVSGVTNTGEPLDAVTNYNIK